MTNRIQSAFFFLVAAHKNQILSILHCAILQSASFQDVHGTSNYGVKMANEKKSTEFL